MGIYGFIEEDRQEEGNLLLILKSCIALVCYNTTIPKVYGT